MYNNSLPTRPSDGVCDRLNFNILRFLLGALPADAVGDQAEENAYHRCADDAAADAECRLYGGEGKAAALGIITVDEMAHGEVEQTSGGKGDAVSK